MSFLRTLFGKKKGQQPDKLNQVNLVKQQALD